MKTNLNHTIVLPVEVNVRNDLQFYSNVHVLEFTSNNLIRSTERSITIPVYMINNGNKTVMITVSSLTKNRNK
jgi:hypothetical protein